MSDEKTNTINEDDPLIFDENGTYISDKEILEKIKELRIKRDQAYAVSGKYAFEKKMISKDIEILGLKNQIAEMNIQAQNKLIKENQDQISNIFVEIGKKYKLVMENVTIDDETGLVEVLPNLVSLCDKRGNFLKTK